MTGSMDRLSQQPAKKSCESVWAPGEHRVDIETGQAGAFGRRSFLLLVPPAPRPLTADGRAPAVVDFHGHSESPYYQKILTNVDGEGEAFGYTVAIPFGTSDAPSNLCSPGLALHQ